MKGDSVFVVLATGDKFNGTIGTISPSLVCMQVFEGRYAGDSRTAFGTEKAGGRFTSEQGTWVCFGTGQILSITWPDEPRFNTSMLMCLPACLGGCDAVV
jgi:hypothetical protein